MYIGDQENHKQLKETPIYLAITQFDQLNILTPKQPIQLAENARPICVHI